MNEISTLAAIEVRNSTHSRLSITWCITIRCCLRICHWLQWCEQRQRSKVAAAAAAAKRNFSHNSNARSYEFFGFRSVYLFLHFFVYLFFVSFFRLNELTSGDCRLHTTTICLGGCYFSRSMAISSSLFSMFVVPALPFLSYSPRVHRFFGFISFGILRTRRAGMLYAQFRARKRCGLFKQIRITYPTSNKSTNQYLFCFRESFADAERCMRHQLILYGDKSW